MPTNLVLVILKPPMTERFRRAKIPEEQQEVIIRPGKEGKRVKARALDLMTAAIALEHNLILVTRNVEDFKDIRGLKLHKAS